MGFAVAVVLSETVDTLETKSFNNVETFSVGFSRKSILFVLCVKYLSIIYVYWK